MGEIRVLVVEDNPGDAALIRYSLAEPGQGRFTIAHASSLKEAVQHLAAQHFDVILLDLSLPDSFGLETVKKILESAPPKAAVVVLSGLDDEELALEAVKQGAQDYLVKGRSDGDVLRRAIRYAIERQRIEEAMRLAEAVFKNVDTGIFVTDAEGAIVRTNPAFTRITGYESEDVIGKTADLLKSGVQEDSFYEEMWEKLRSLGHWEGEIWNRRKSGNIYPEWLRIDAVLDSAGRLTNYVATFTDITFRKEIENQLRLQATHDTLTGLPNRYLFTDRLLHALAQADRSTQKAALLFVDLDGFKEVNDSYGHMAGDQLLIEVATRLQALVRATDTVARLAGDEFTLILSGVIKWQDASTVAEKVVETLSQPFLLKEGQASISASVGIALYPDDATDSDKLLIAADAAMYAIKQKGKNGFGFYRQPQS
ncbi:MAG: diguanylate cyclase [Alphaproteobacteria bacterium]|nr:diguanylate cyclase [Alphaproteobacteria bacterium]